MPIRASPSTACNVDNYESGRIVTGTLMGNIEQALQNIPHGCPTFGFTLFRIFLPLPILIEQTPFYNLTKGLGIG